MANYFFSTSLEPSSNRETLWNLKETLKDAGWTVASSSDGSTFASGDILTASGDFNGFAWFVVRQPQGATGSYGGVQREFAFQRGNRSDVDHLRAAYSYKATFTGSAGSTSPPSASDGVRFVGSEFPDFSYDTTFFPADPVSYKLHIAADGDSPYGWYVVGVPNGGGNPSFAIVHEPLETSTTASQDTDPYIQYSANSSVLSLNTSTSDMTDPTTGSTVNHPACWMRKGQSDESYVGMAAMAMETTEGEYSDDNTYGTTNPFTSNDDLLPIFFYRPGNITPAPGGFKGASRQMRMAVTPPRATADTISTTSSASKDLIVFQSVAMPWDGTTPSV